MKKFFLSLVMSLSILTSALAHQDIPVENEKNKEQKPGYILLITGKITIDSSSPLTPVITCKPNTSCPCVGVGQSDGRLYADLYFACDDFNRTWLTSAPAINPMPDGSEGVYIELQVEDELDQ